jgi:hypothetical protein
MYTRIMLAHQANKIYKQNYLKGSDEEQGITR